MLKLEILRTVSEVKSFIKRQKKEGKSIGLVPTMGALHAGHLSLMKQAKAKCDTVIASVFVNPVQFGPKEDFDAYPRMFSKDCALLEAAGVDAVFHPAAYEMYPEDYTTFVTLDGDITQKLCGAKRPGHFRGVATVVTKLINITEADKAFFGQKDAQQVVVIKRFVRDLNLNVEIEMAPIVRDENGLALSSRNQYLSAAEKKAALVLSQSLQTARQAYESGERATMQLKKIIEDQIATEALAEIDYIEIYSFPELKVIKEVNKSTIIALAVRFGATRLIDNMIIGGEK